MEVTQALRARRSVRAFLPDAPPRSDCADDSSRSRTGGLRRQSAALARGGPHGRAAAGVVGGRRQAQPEEGPDNQSYPPGLWEPYRTRRFANGEDLYRSIGIPREDKAGRLQQLAKNAELFGAPVGIFVCVDERMGQPQWADLGIYLQSLMLLAVQHGLATCAQGFWRRYAGTLQQQLGLPEPYRVAFGVALGYEDAAAPINTLRSSRAPWAEWGEMRGF